MGIRRFWSQVNSKDARGAAKAVQVALGLALLAAGFAVYVGFTYLRAKVFGVDWVLWPFGR